MSKSNNEGVPYSGARVPEVFAQQFETPPDVKYVVPFDWGGLHVTEGANSDYALFPFVPTIAPTEYKGTASTSTTPRVDLLLTTYDEIGMEYPEVFAENNSGLGVYSRTEVIGDNIAITLAFPDADFQSKNLIDGAKKTIAQMMGIEMEDEEVLGSVVSEDNVPIAESMANEAPHIMAHALSGMTGMLTEKMVQVWAKNNYDKQVVGKLTRNGLIYLLGAAGVTFIHEEILAETNNLTTTVNSVEGAAFVAAYIAAGIYSVRQYFKVALKVARTGVYPQSLITLSLPSKVSSDIHNAFCRNHFEENMKQNLGDQ